MLKIGIRGGYALLAVIGALFLVGVYTPLANSLAIPLLRAPSSVPKADVGVVMSGGRYSNGSLNEAALERTVTAVRLYHQGLAPRLLFTGGPCCGASASALMANLARQLGVPGSAIILEEESTRTYESAVRSTALLRDGGFRTVILVTSSLHLVRAQLAFRSAGVIVHPVRASDTNLLLVSSAAERLSLFQAAIHEYGGLAAYWWWGWI